MSQTKTKHSLLILATLGLLMAGCGHSRTQTDRHPANELSTFADSEALQPSPSGGTFVQLAVLHCKGCPDGPVSFTQQTLEHSEVHYSSGELEEKAFVHLHARPRKKTSVFPPEISFQQVVSLAVAADTWHLMGLQYDKSSGTKVKKSANYRVLLSIPPSTLAFVAHLIVCLKAPCHDGDDREFGDNEVISLYPICGEGVVLVDARTPAQQKLLEGKPAALPRECEASDLKRFKTTTH